MPKRAPNVHVTRRMVTARLMKANLTEEFQSVKFEIKSRFDGAVLFSIKTSSWRLALEAAIKTGANLSGANLSGANLSGAESATLVLARLSIVSQGDIVGWKKLCNGLVTELRIPAASKRLNAYGSRKCRAEYADVVSITSAEGTPVAFGNGMHDTSFVYRTGTRVFPDSFDSNVQVECSHGIHFFITREEAEAYNY